MRNRSVLQSSAKETLAACSKSRRHTVFVAGFPCQDISPAGTGRGLDGTKSGLWDHFWAVIEKYRPGWVVVENSSYLRFRGLEKILRQFDALGYVVQWHCIPASAIGAHHRRDRLWVIANLDPEGKLQSERCLEKIRRRIGNEARWAAEPRVARVVYGLPGGMDRTLSLGNAIVPQIAQIIAQGIKECMMEAQTDERP